MGAPYIYDISHLRVNKFLNSIPKKVFFFLPKPQTNYSLALFIIIEVLSPQVLLQFGEQVEIDRSKIQAVGCGSTCARPSIVLLKQDIINFCPLPCDVFLRLFRLSIQRSKFTVVPFPQEVSKHNTFRVPEYSQLDFSSRSLVFNFSGAGDPSWQCSTDWLLFSGT